MHKQTWQFALHLLYLIDWIIHYTNIKKVNLCLKTTYRNGSAQDPMHRRYLIYQGQVNIECVDGGSRRLWIGWRAVEGITVVEVLNSTAKRFHLEGFFFYQLCWLL